MDVLGAGLNLARQIHELLPAGLPAVLGVPSAAEPLAAALSSASPPEAREAAVQFEGLFWSLMLKEMRQSLESDTLFGSDSGDVLGGLFDLFIGQHMSQAQALGIASLVRQQMENLTSEDRNGRVPPPLPTTRTDLVAPLSRAP